MGGIERQVGSLLTPVLDLMRNPQVWGIIALFAIFVVSLELVEAYLTGPWPHQRRGGDRSSGALALGNRSAWLAVAILLLPGLLLAVVNAVILFYRRLPTGYAGLPLDGLHVTGLGLVLLAWAVFVLGSANVLHIGHYLRRVGLITPATLLVCLLLGNTMLLLVLIEVAR